MAFTYLGDLSTNREKVRFYINDRTVDSGPRPSSANFSDAEIDGLITAEGGSWQRAVAAAFDVLAGEWAVYVDTSIGPRKQSLSQTAAAFEKKAVRWRREHGLGATRAGSRAVTRVDGYSDDVASDEV